MSVEQFIKVWQATQPKQTTAIRTDAVLFGTVPSLFTWPGDLREHLAESPHNMNPNELRIASPRQLVAWHDGWHLQNR